MRHDGRQDTVYTGLITAIVLVGIAMLSSATGPVAYSKFNSSFWFVKHQILYGLLPGAVLFYFMSRISYRKYEAWSRSLLIATVVFLLLVFVPGLGATWGKTKSWIALGGFSLQPSEIAKLTFILYLAGWLKRRSETKDGLRGSLVPFIIILGVVTGLLALEPDLGMMVIMAATAVVLYFVAGAPGTYIGAIAVLGAAGVYALIKAAPYRAARLVTFLHPELDPKGIGYHINQALLAIGSGGIFGVGYGRSRQKFLYLPEVAGDSIFAVIAEELGLIVSLAFVGLFVALVLRGLRIAERAPDRYGMLVAVGITTWFGLQAAINIGSMVGLLPLTGLTLPFVSYGGTSLAVSLAAAGIVVNISRRQ